MVLCLNEMGKRRRDTFLASTLGNRQSAFVFLSSFCIRCSCTDVRFFLPHPKDMKEGEIKEGEIKEGDFKEGDFKAGEFTFQLAEINGERWVLANQRRA